MSTEANREAIRREFVAWQDEVVPIANVFAPEMTWRIEGHPVVAGDYANRQEIIDRVLAPLGAPVAEGERFRPVRIHALCADDDTAIVRWTATGSRTTGSPTTTLCVVHDLARRARRRHRVLRQHRVRRALAPLRRGGDVSLRQESRKPGASAPA